MIISSVITHNAPKADANQPSTDISNYTVSAAGPIVNTLPIEGLHTVVVGPQAVIIEADQEPVQAERHLFGNNLREAIAIVKDWTKHP